MSRYTNGLKGRNVSNSVHYPSSITVEKHNFSSSREPHSQYGLTLAYKEGFPPRLVHGVHLPSEVVDAIESRNVRALWIDELAPNSPAMRLLPNQPDSLVTCVELMDGTRLRVVPPVLKRLRRSLCVQTVFLLFVSASILCLAKGPLVAWGGALLFAWALERLRVLRHLPLDRFRAFSAVKPKA